jgi:hypothetical protein
MNICNFYFLVTLSRIIRRPSCCGLQWYSRVTPLPLSSLIPLFLHQSKDYFLTECYVVLCAWCSTVSSASDRLARRAQSHLWKLFLLPHTVYHGEHSLGCENCFFSLRPSLTESTVSVMKTVSSASANTSQRPKLCNNRHGNQSVTITQITLGGFYIESTQCILSRYGFWAALNNIYCDI